MTTTSMSTSANLSGAAKDGRQRNAAALFDPVTIGQLQLANRLVMAPMTRFASPGGIPGEDVAAYYARRAKGGVGMIITEGTYVPHWAAGFDERVPNFHGEMPFRGWRRVVDSVQSHGAKIIPQLWHIGLMKTPEIENMTEAFKGKVSGVGPSGLLSRHEQVCDPMTEQDIADVIKSFADAAADAKAAGFDGIQIHGAHGYLIDQFLWAETNIRDDDWGGDIGRRSRFGAAVVAACRERVGADFPIMLRLSQWKSQDYETRLTTNPDELEQLLAPLIEAGVDVFDCSQRRFWKPEFDGSDLSFAGWTRRISGKPVITVGSVGLEQELVHTLYKNEGSEAARLDRLIEMFEGGEFDLVAVGRALLSDPEWPNKVRRGDYDRLVAYAPEFLANLI